LYYYGYRYYEPTAGKWLSRDPIAERGGLNLYAFKDPVNTVDPEGLASRISELRSEMKGFRRKAGESGDACAQRAAAIAHRWVQVSRKLLVTNIDDIRRRGRLRMAYEREAEILGKMLHVIGVAGPAHIGYRACEHYAVKGSKSAGVGAKSIFGIHVALLAVDAAHAWRLNLDFVTQLSKVEQDNVRMEEMLYWSRMKFAKEFLARVPRECGKAQ
jgi:hypothetical protein